MPKTITLRLDDADYAKIKSAAKAENRTISNFIETRLLHDIMQKNFIDDEEMNEIMRDKVLVTSLRAGIKEADSKRYKIRKQ